MKRKGHSYGLYASNIEKAISVACKNYYGGNENVVFKVDPERTALTQSLSKQ